jgi:splicing factor 3A subunit 3
LLFSGEEGYGRYLDLYTNHTSYCNLKNIGKRPGYLQFLDILLAAENNLVHSDLPKETRFSKDFETYILHLHTIIFIDVIQVYKKPARLSPIIYEENPAS